jgi:hypothetical protein
MFDSIGGTVQLNDNSDVTVALYYDVDDQRSDREPVWQLAGDANEGTFAISLPDRPAGRTIAYQVRITAPDVAMTEPVVIDDVVLTYDSTLPRVKDSGHDRSASRPNGNDRTQSKSGRANDGSTSRAGGNGTTADNQASHSPSVRPPSPKVQPARTSIDRAIPARPATSGSVAAITGYPLGKAVTPAMLGSRSPGKISDGSGAPSQVRITQTVTIGYIALGACALLLAVAPWIVASRRLRALVAFDHRSLESAEEWR